MMRICFALLPNRIISNELNTTFLLSALFFFHCSPALAITAENDIKPLLGNWNIKTNVISVSFGLLILDGDNNVTYYTDKRGNLQSKGVGHDPRGNGHVIQYKYEWDGKRFVEDSIERTPGQRDQIKHIDLVLVDENHLTGTGATRFEGTKRGAQFAVTYYRLDDNFKPVTTTRPKIEKISDPKPELVKPPPQVDPLKPTIPSIVPESVVIEEPPAPEPPPEVVVVANPTAGPSVHICQLIFMTLLPCLFAFVMLLRLRNTYANFLTITRGKSSASASSAARSLSIGLFFCLILGTLSVVFGEFVTPPVMAVLLFLISGSFTHCAVFSVRSNLSNS